MLTELRTAQYSSERLVSVLEWVPWLLAAEVLWWLTLGYTIHQIRSLWRDIESIPVELL